MDHTQWAWMDDEEVDEARSSKGDQSRIFFTTLKPDTPQVYYFLTKPGEVAGDWVNYRELSTRDGLKVGPDLPTDLSYGILVQDYRLVRNEVTGRREYEYDNNLDPITAGTPGNQIWTVGAKNTDKSGLIRVQWRCAVNVVDAITGYHKILKLSLTAKDDLKKYFAVKDEDGDFDIQGRPYEILYTGEGFKWNVAIRPIRPGASVIRDNKSIEIPKASEFPPPLDVRDLLIEQREELDALLASLPTRSGKPMETGLPPDHAMAAKYDPAMDSSDMAGSSGMDVFAGPPKEVTLTEKYLAMSPARLRSILSKAGEPPEKGALKEEMAAKAASLNL